MKLYLKQIELGPLQNFVYLIGSLQTREAIVVDPAWDIPRLLEIARADEMRVVGAFITHTHPDHVNGLAQLLEKTDARVFVHKQEAAGLSVEPGSIEPVEGGQQIPLGTWTLSVLHTPGHTPGSICLSVGDRLITGDTLFIGGCGRCDLPGGDPEALFKSLTNLSRLEDHLVVHPGHHYAAQPTALLAEEKSYNPFLQAATFEEFRRFIGSVRRS